MVRKLKSYYNLKIMSKTSKLINIISYHIPSEPNLSEYKTKCANKNDQIDLITVLVLGQVQNLF